MLPFLVAPNLSAQEATEPEPLVGEEVAPIIFVGVDGGAAFGDFEADSSEFILTGAIGYQFPVGLWLEYEGGAAGGEYVGWTKAGWAVSRSETLALVAGVANINADAQFYGGWAHAMLSLGSNRAVRVLGEAAYAPETEDVAYSGRLGFYLWGTSMGDLVGGGGE